MGQQISIEAALAAFRQRHGELADENVLLKARVSELEEENTRLSGGQEQLPSSAGTAAEHG